VVAVRCARRRSYSFPQRIIQRHPQASRDAYETSEPPFSGGSTARSPLHEYLDLAFPEHLNSHIARHGWRPEVFDYLYLAFTDALVFSPTDVMPLARWAKLAMAVESAASLVILGLVIARAVNILK
jgi:hypothetical protein